MNLHEDRTSRLSPYLHFGCISALGCVARAAGHDAWIRELCWRDFYAQLLRGDPRLAHADMHARTSEPRDDPDALAAWTEGRTGYPLVAAGMRQLAAEGWMHNRARLVAASFLVKDLGLDWRAGARHFEDLLVDGDVASNRGKWQWVAGTGVDHTRARRTFSPTLQAHKRDPSGDYVRRYVPELAHVEGAAIHEPWRLGGVRGYPDPIVQRPETRRLALFA